MKFIALLRGINVSGQKKILMKDLRALLSDCDAFQNIQTYIQSGNIVFESNCSNTHELRQLIFSIIYKEYDFEVPIQVYASDQWENMLSTNPFLDADQIDINRLYVTMLEKIPSEQNITTLKSIDFSPELYTIKGNVIYTCYFNGVGRSKMTNSIFEKKLKVSATSRNWKTVCKISLLLSS